MRKRNIIRYLLVFLLLILAVGLVAYPFVANYIFENRADSIVSTVEEAADAIDNSEQEAEIKAANEYNQVIASGRVQLTDPFIEDTLANDSADYESLLCITSEGVMGFVEIPSISLSIPIYHGTSDAVLEKGAGHLQGTSLPVGGESTHSVLTGHTGLSNAKLFTDLTELEEGDIFFLNVMGEKLAYEVDQIKVVLPSELNDLQVIPGEDYCTLLTCTPYGVNTHRLLVRGTRTDYQEAVDNPVVFEKKAIESKWMSEYKRALAISLAFFTASLSLLFAYRAVSAHLRKLKTGEITDDFR